MVDHRRKPWHFWPVATLALIWHAALAVDYVLTKTLQPDFLALFPARPAAFFTSLPLWADVIWALGVWSGLLGAILMAAAASGAALSLGMGFLGLAALTVGLLFVPPGLVSVVGGGGLALIIGAAALSAAFWAYAREQKQLGVLA